MGLDCSHDAFHGAYSAFNRLRMEVCRAMGGSFPPHFAMDERGIPIRDEHGFPVYDNEKDAGFWYWGDGYNQETHPGLMEFLSHNDCDGEIPPEMCAKVASELETLLPKVESLGSLAVGHIAARGGYVGVLRRFISGCRAAAAAGEPLEFH